MNDLVKSLYANLRAIEGNAQLVSLEINLRESIARIETQAAEIERLRNRDWVGELLRWDVNKQFMAGDKKWLYLGPLLVGAVHRTTGGKPWPQAFHVFLEGDFTTEAEARAAVEKAVREALQPSVRAYKLEEEVANLHSELSQEIERNKE